MRRTFVAGNWKMNTTREEALKLTAALLAKLGDPGSVQIAVCPPFPYLQTVGESLRGSPIELGGQNLYPEAKGAFTGEVSPAMLKDCGCRWVILGHSERRHVMGETNAFIRKKVLAALAAGLGVILCIGEQLAEREAQRTEAVLAEQLAGSLPDLSPEQRQQMVLAYEPVWAIGTGVNATPEQAESAHQFIRGELAKRFGAAAAQGWRIQYGGSVTAANAATLLAQANIDGVLVGGASLKPDDFLAIIAAGRAAKPG